jgi:DNA-binding response OmpR family regulator
VLEPDALTKPRNAGSLLATARAVMRGSGAADADADAAARVAAVRNFIVK